MDLKNLSKDRYMRKIKNWKLFTESVEDSLEDIKYR